MSGLNAIAAQPDQRHKIEQYKIALQQAISSGNVKDCHDFASHSKISMILCVSDAVKVVRSHADSFAAAVLSDNVPLVVSRQLLTAFAQELSKLPPASHKEVAEGCIPTFVQFCTTAIS